MSHPFCSNTKLFKFCILFKCIIWALTKLLKLPEGLAAKVQLLSLRHGGHHALKGVLSCTQSQTLHVNVFLGQALLRQQQL